ncbi:hypothetical protein [Nocardiopsis dassonvillei]|uniref:hypothetical protein n=1 Tax=Nocardiopsis dassonvillei TaxID=2014 RepID=UPI00363AB086
MTQDRESEGGCYFDEHLDGTGQLQRERARKITDMTTGRSLKDDLRLWGSIRASRDFLIRRAHAARIERTEIAALMGISLPTVDTVLKKRPGVFDPELFETHRAQVDQAREKFWREESQDLPPGSRPTSWHATHVHTVWETDVPPEEEAEQMVAVAVQMMRDQLPGPLLVRTIPAARAATLGFPTYADGDVVIGVQYQTVLTHTQVPRLGEQETPLPVWELVAVRVDGAAAWALTQDDEAIGGFPYHDEDTPSSIVGRLIGEGTLPRGAVRIRAEASDEPGLHEKHPFRYHVTIEPISNILAASQLPG